MYPECEILVFNERSCWSAAEDIGFFSVHSLPHSSWICILVVCQVVYWKLSCSAVKIFASLGLIFLFSSRCRECTVKWHSIGLSSSVPLRSCKGAERQCCHYAFALSQIGQHCGLIWMLHPLREAIEDQCTSSVPLSLKLRLNWFNWNDCRQPGWRWCSSAQGKFTSPESHNRGGGSWDQSRFLKEAEFTLLFDSIGVSELNC